MSNDEHPIANAIADYLGRRHRLQDQIATINQVLIGLYAAYKAATGRDYVEGQSSPPRQRRRRKGTPLIVEEILRQRGPLEIKEILAELGERGVTTNKQTLTGMLVRYNQMGERFRRVSPSTYAVRD